MFKLTCNVFNCLMLYNFLNMSHYNNTLMPGKPTVNDIGSFEKAVMTNSKESIEKHLSHMKIDQDKLSYALFLSI